MQKCRLIIVHPSLLGYHPTWQILVSIPTLALHQDVWTILGFYPSIARILPFYVPFFPKQVYLWGSILEKKRLDTLVGALCCVGRGFGCAGRAGLGWAWDLAVLGALGWVGRGVWLWWGLGADLAFCVWFVFVFICMSISDVYHGAWAKQSLALVNETWFWAIPCSKSVMWSERNGSKGEKRQLRQPTQLQKDSIDNSAALQLLLYSFNTTIRVGKWTASSQCKIEIADCVAEIEPKRRQKESLLWVLFDLIHSLALFGVYAGVIVQGNLKYPIFAGWSRPWPPRKKPLRQYPRHLPSLQLTKEPKRGFLRAGFDLFFQPRVDTVFQVENGAVVGKLYENPTKESIQRFQKAVLQV